MFELPAEIFKTNSFIFQFFKKKVDETLLSNNAGTYLQNKSSNDVTFNGKNSRPMRSKGKTLYK